MMRAQQISWYRCAQHPTYGFIELIPHIDDEDAHKASVKIRANVIYRRTPSKPETGSSQTDAGSRWRPIGAGRLVRIASIWPALGVALARGEQGS